jgi:hypothetical protein
MSLEVTPDDCGLGVPGATCAYLVLSKHTWLCGREDPDIKGTIDERLSEGSYRAKVAPTLPYPDCQAERAEMAPQAPLVDHDGG